MIPEDLRKQIIEKLDYKEIYKDIQNQKKATDGYISGQCPFHDDNANSFGFHTENLNWVCFSGCGKGDVFDYLMYLQNRPFKDIIEYVKNITGISSKEKKDKKINIDEINSYHKKLSTSPDLLNHLINDRGLLQETIDKYNIGYDTGRNRYSIPIYDRNNKILNVRFYSNIDTSKKMTNLQGFGSPSQLYGLHDLMNSDPEEPIILCEGEIDKLILSQNGFLSMTSTAGVSNFRPDWVHFLIDRDIIILFDCDKPGKEASYKILNAFKGKKINSIRIVELPLTGEKDDKDISDYFIKHNKTTEDLIQLMENTPIYEFPDYQKEEEETITLESLIEIEKEELIDRKIQVDITIYGETSSTFHAVERFVVEFCQKNKEGTCFECPDVIEVQHGSQEYIGSCMSNNAQVLGMLRTYCCKYGQRPGIKITKKTTIKEFFCCQKINRIIQTGEEIQDDNHAVINGKYQELMELRAYYLGSDTIPIGNYRAVGWVKSHPKTQHVTFLIESLTHLDDDFQKFKIKDNINYLEEARLLDLNSILNNLVYNVTRIYKREDILLTLLLTYCSPLWIKAFKEVIRGWLLSCIIGDSGCGKTQTYQRITNYIGIGDIVSGLTASRTGLSYALVEHKQKGWTVKVGRYPANTRKLLIVDESQYLDQDELRSISKAMEEGFMQVDRVHSKGFETQTRLVFICNPKFDRIMDKFAHGCEALKTVFPATIIRRLDLVAFLNTSDLSIDFMDNYLDEVENKLPSEVLRSIIYRAWNLPVNNIILDKNVTKTCIAKSKQLSKKFGSCPDIPLIHTADIRNTLVRLSCSIANLLVSCSENNLETALVKEEHVIAVTNFLDLVYSNSNCGLDDYSSIQKENSELDPDKYIEIKKFFVEKKENERYALEEQGYFSKVIKLLWQNSRIRRTDLAEILGCKRETIDKVIGSLRSFQFLHSDKDGYQKKPVFVQFLRKFLKDRPNFFD